MTAPGNPEGGIGRPAFLSRSAGMIGESRFRKYAVLVPIVEVPDGKCLLFERRAARLRRQPGEICFPGGKLEPGESPLRCAVRETMEELRIAERQIDVLGPGDTFVSPFNIIIYPFIGALKDYGNTYNPDEVAEVLSVPVNFFVKNPPETYGSTIVNRLPEDFPYERIPGGENYPWASGAYDVLFYQYGDLIIWGITALHRPVRGRAHRHVRAVGGIQSSRTAAATARSCASRIAGSPRVNLRWRVLCRKASIPSILPTLPPNAA